MLGEKENTVIQLRYLFLFNVTTCSKRFILFTVVLWKCFEVHIRDTRLMCKGNTFLHSIRQFGTPIDQDKRVFQDFNYKFVCERTQTKSRTNTNETGHILLPSIRIHCYTPLSLHPVQIVHYT